MPIFVRFPVPILALVLGCLVELLVEKYHRPRPSGILHHLFRGVGNGVIFIVAGTVSPFEMFVLSFTPFSSDIVKNMRDPNALGAILFGGIFFVNVVFARCALVLSTSREVVRSRLVLHMAMFSVPESCLCVLLDYAWMVGKV